MPSATFQKLQSLIKQRNTHESQCYPLLFDSYSNLLHVSWQESTSAADNTTNVSPSQSSTSPMATEYLSHQIIQLQTKLRHISSHHLQLIREKSVFVDSLLDATNQVTHLERRQLEMQHELDTLTGELSISQKQLQRLQHANEQLLVEISRRDRELESIDETNEALQREVLDLRDQLDTKMRNEMMDDINARSRDSSTSTTRRGRLKLPNNKSSRAKKGLFSSGMEKRGASSGEDQVENLLGEGGSNAESHGTNNLSTKYNNRKRQSTTLMHTHKDSGPDLPSSPKQVTSNLHTQIINLPLPYNDLISASNQPILAATTQSSRDGQHCVHCFYISQNTSSSSFNQPTELPSSTEKILCAHFLENFTPPSNLIHSSLATVEEGKILLAYSGADSVIHLSSLQQMTQSGLGNGASSSDSSRSFTPPPTAHLRGHTAQINTLADCLLSTRLLSGSQDKTIKLWDTATQKLIKTYSYGSSCLKLASMPKHVNPALFASIQFDHTLRLFDARLGDAHHEMCVVDYTYPGGSRSRGVQNSSGSEIRLLDLQCAERYCVVSNSSGKVDIFDVRNMSHGALRTLDLETLHSPPSSSDGDKVSHSPGCMLNLQLSPCLNYVACQTKWAVLVYDLLQGEFVDEVVLGGDLGIVSFSWNKYDKHLYLVRSDNCIEVRHVL
mmetsp:Transcript_3696/g.14056  ORF Transcript_3696/g.14056 Transcript_3696/m.14056 type:complete len:669 (-) Transcript_3696:1897-3903(-)